ncbi:hypothetical protein Hanom_Chr04g00346911 [Helianthus anomalus]
MYCGHIMYSHFLKDKMMKPLFKNHYKSKPKGRLPPPLVDYRFHKTRVIRLKLNKTGLLNNTYFSYDQTPTFIINI